ncbi:MAG: hypothetical protein JXA73_20060 [Acidobacteria bacterium]|nr:hypothetical protein [Acidobacteriota bacterium]
MDNQEPFVFQTERRLVMLTGKSARNLTELLDHIREVSGSSIFYHTHHQYLSHHFEKPVFHSDFSSWTSLALLEEALSEKLAAIDILSFGSIRELREAIIKTIESYLDAIGGRRQNCLPGQEFHFCESKSFIMPSGLVARDIPEFFAKLPKVANPSLYFHFFEARLRLERPTNDFSSWLSYRGAPDLAQAIDRLNPYKMTMEELREEIIKLGN